MVHPLRLFRQLAPKLKDVNQRVLLVVGSGDLLLPSGEEGTRLEKVLPRCRLKVCSLSHALDPLQFMHCHAIADLLWYSGRLLVQAVCARHL